MDCDQFLSGKLLIFNELIISKKNSQESCNWQDFCRGLWYNFAR